MEAARLEEAERRRAEQERNREEQRRRKQEDRERRRQQREAERNRGPAPRSQERARAHTPKAAKPKKERTVGDKPVFVSKNVVGRDPSLAIGRDPSLVGAKANLALGRDRSLAKGSNKFNCDGRPIILVFTFYCSSIALVCPLTQQLPWFKV